MDPTPAEAKLPFLERLSAEIRADLEAAFEADPEVSCYPFVEERCRLKIGARRLGTFVPGPCLDNMVATTREVCVAGRFLRCARIPRELVRVLVLSDGIDTVHRPLKWELQKHLTRLVDDARSNTDRYRMIEVLAGYLSAVESLAALAGRQFEHQEDAEFFDICSQIWRGECHDVIKADKKHLAIDRWEPFFGDLKDRAFRLAHTHVKTVNDEFAAAVEAVRTAAKKAAARASLERRLAELEGRLAELAGKLAELRAAAVPE